VQVAKKNGGSEDIYDVHSDHLDTSKMLTDDTGAVRWRAAHEAFGKAHDDKDPDGDSTEVTFNIRFPGQYFDAESGLHYNRFRTYDPVTGRYISSDPIGQAGGLNIYRYVYDNPINLDDPLGLGFGDAVAATTGNLISRPDPMAIYYDALDWASGLDGLSDGQQDAVRHCASCL
jgi:RHS repeat-associated protein